MAFETATRSSTLYSTPEWRAIRRAQLSAEPYCRICRAEGVTTVANTADHIVAPHTSDASAFWLASISTNLQSLCRHHSNQKTAHEVALRMGRTVTSKRPTEPHPGETR